MRTAGPPAAFAVAVVVVWQLIAELSGIPESSLPAPSQVAAALWEERDLLWDNAWVTIAEVVLGFAAAIVVGVLLAAAIHASAAIERAVYPWLVVSQTVPIPAIAPIVVIWTGFDLRPKVIVVALVSFFPIVVATVAGLRATDPALIDLLRTLRASRWQRFAKARVPASLPFVFSGLRIAAALTVVGAVFAEWVGSSEGLGHLILTLNNQGATAEMFAVIVVLSAIGIALFGLVVLAERLALPWYRGPRARVRRDAP